jgi:hypothetical protein
MSVSCDGYIRIWLQAFLHRKYGISQLFISAVDLHSIVCRTALRIMFLALSVAFDGHFRIRVADFASWKRDICGLWRTFVDLYSLAGRNG